MRSGGGGAPVSTSGGAASGGGSSQVTSPSIAWNDSLRSWASGASSGMVFLVPNRPRGQRVRTRIRPIRGRDRGLWPGETIRLAASGGCRRRKSPAWHVKCTLYLCKPLRFTFHGTVSMCGIVGYTGSREAEPILLEGLRRLEYRGYDSAGLATADRRPTCTCARRAGRIADLAELLREQPAPGLPRHQPHALGDARRRHRRATPTRTSAATATVAVVHNGVIENYAALKRQLQAEGVVFHSDTDTEVIAQLIARHLERRPGRGRPQGAAAAQGDLRPGRRQPAHPGPDRRRPPGQPAGRRHRRRRDFLASDPRALVGNTEQVVYLQDHQMCVLTRRRAGTSSTPTTRRVDAPRPPASTGTPGDADKGDFEHYMLKEIYEQPEALENAMRGRLDEADATRPLRRPEPRRRSSCARSSASS